MHPMERAHCKRGKRITDRKVHDKKDSNWRSNEICDTKQILQRLTSEKTIGSSTTENFNHERCGSSEHIKLENLRGRKEEKDQKPHTDSIVSPGTGDMRPT